MLSSAQQSKGESHGKEKATQLLTSSRGRKTLDHASQ
jgi:hypothetical protein